MDTGIATVVGVIVGGPVGSAIAAGSNIFLSHSGEGRKITQAVAKYFFDNLLGLPPQISYMLSSITLNAAMSWGLWEVYGALAGTPTATVNTKDPVADYPTDPKYEEIRANQGSQTVGAGRDVETTVNDGGKAYDILDEQGNRVGVLGRGDAKLEVVPEGIGAYHTAISISGPNGWFNGSDARGIIEFVTGTCNQAINQAALKAGYSMTINGATGGWFSYISAAIYGPYGSATPALSYFDEERNRRK